MDKLPIEFKTKWIEALRSGQFEQGRFALESRNKFCCLGVLCKVNGVPTYKDLEEKGRVEMGFISTEADEIPRFLRGETDITERLSNMNDGQGKYCKIKSFLEIADWIEENL